MKADHLFEVSWEICNKVGGIHTVVTSKIKPMLDHYGENYYAMGPWFPGKSVSDEFKESVPPDNFKKVFSMLAEEGIKCHYGNWKINGDPKTILIDFADYKHKLNEIKGSLWESYGIDSLGTQYHDFDEPMLWSTAAGRVVEELSKTLKGKVVCHAHEWLSGGALLQLHRSKSGVATVFTTHATMLGRTLAAHDYDLYQNLKDTDPQQKAYEMGIQAKFLTERACAKNANVFSTVSEITGLEATHFLAKKPDILLPNGLDTKSFPTFDDASIKHKQYKAKIKRFLMFHFFPYYTFDLDDTLIYFLAGRYEFKDKGIDVFIEALGRLNEQLKSNGFKKTIVAFIWVPTSVKDIKLRILENKTYYEDIEDSVHDIAADMKERLIYGLVGQKQIDAEFLFGTAGLKQVEKKLSRFKRSGNPPVCTHNLNTAHDEILEAVNANNLHNTKEDRVKVVFYPIYLTGADQLTDLNYYESIMASHLGVFPSYYEPWGYTPLETGALGVASVTTDLAGFGRYISDHTGKKNPGIYVLDRLGKSQQEVVEQLTNVMREFGSGEKQDRIQNKLRAKRLADIADWNLLIEQYFKAHEMAVSRLS